MAHPENWNKLSNRDKLAQAMRLLFVDVDERNQFTVRAKLLIGQALARAILVMRTEEHPEISNIEDMECLGMLFSPWFEITMDQQKNKDKLHVVR